MRRGFSAYEPDNPRSCSPRRFRRGNRRLARDFPHPEVAPHHREEPPLDDGLVVASPGNWEPPPGVRPMWDWTPSSGARPRLDRAPAWVRVWYVLPFIDRYAYSWMWHHGCWDVRQHEPMDR
jgi:hypothetical protein